MKREGLECFHHCFLTILLCISVMEVSNADQEVDALCDIKTYMNPLFWLSTSPCSFSAPCQDYLAGVTCELHVTGLQFTDNIVSGTIPDTIGDFSFMTDLEIGNNLNLSGTIPSTISALTRITSIKIYQNLNLTGTIPDTLNNLKKLTELQLQGNALTGTIPTSLNLATSLLLLELDSNLLEGNILELINLPQLTLLTGNSNRFSGTLPDSIASQLPKLETLSLSFNRYSGTIPQVLPATLSYLNLASNGLSGTIPKSFANLTLTNLYLNSNLLSGTEAEFNISACDLSYNCFDTTTTWCDASLGTCCDDFDICTCFTSCVREFNPSCCQDESTKFYYPTGATDSSGCKVCTPSSQWATLEMCSVSRDDEMHASTFHLEEGQCNWQF